MEDDIISPEVVQRYKDKFFALNSTKVDLYSKESIDWFRKRISKDSRLSAKKLIEASEYKKKRPTKSAGLVGRLYLYDYKAEQAGHKETNTYDRYPMVFFFNIGKSKLGDTVLYGLNVHYLTPSERQLLFLAILKIRSSKTITPTTKAKLTWDVIKSMVSSSIYEKAVHAYRADRFKSPLVEIPATDWSIAVFLKLEKFVSVTGEKIYQTDIKRRLKKR